MVAVCHIYMKGELSHSIWIFFFIFEFRGVNDRSSFNTDHKDNKLNAHGSFLNLQSSMQFSYLKRVRKGKNIKDSSD